MLSFIFPPMSTGGAIFFFLLIFSLAIFKAIANVVNWLSEKPKPEIGEDGFAKLTPEQQAELDQLNDSGKLKSLF